VRLPSRHVRCTDLAGPLTGPGIDHGSLKMDSMDTIRVVATLRAAYGAIMTLATPTLLRRMVPEENPSGSYLLFARTLGIRNLAFGLGCLRATRNGASDDVRRWVGAWLLSDVADIVAGVTAKSLVGRRGAVVAAAVPLPFAASGVWFLRQKTRTRP
jgi:hypothetical protein